MTDDKILEAMAKAIALSTYIKDGLSELGRTKLASECWDFYSPMAQAALNAYRAVSDEAKDAARINWADKHGCGMDIRQEGEIVMIYNDGNRASGHDIRSAIDAAMAKESEGE